MAPKWRGFEGFLILGSRGVIGSPALVCDSSSDKHRRDGSTRIPNLDNCQVGSLSIDYSTRHCGSKIRLPTASNTSWTQRDSLRWATNATQPAQNVESTVRLSLKNLRNRFLPKDVRRRNISLKNIFESCQKK